MATYATVGKIVKDEFIPEKRLPENTSYGKMIDILGLVSASTRTFITVNSVEGVPKGMIITLSRERQSARDGKFQIFDVPAEFQASTLPGNLRYFKMSDVTPVVVKDIDKQSCLVQRDYKKEALERFQERVAIDATQPRDHHRGRMAEAPRQRDVVDTTCPHCGEDLVEVGISYRADVVEYRSMSIDSNGTITGTECEDADTQDERDYTCTECDGELDSDFMSHINY